MIQPIRLRYMCVLGLLVLFGQDRATADSPWLYGIHWWGYSPGSIDSTPATLLDAPAYGGWDVETILTHSASWWGAAYFQPLYQNLYGSRNISIITRIDYNWGETVPSPTNPHYAGWPSTVTGVVNTLRPYAHIWIIGNEPNLIGEGNNWPSGQVTPAGYATIYRNVRNAIRAGASASPAGSHQVLIAPVSPGGIIGGVRWMSGTDWLGQVIDNIPASEIDGFAIHSYGGSVAEFRAGYAEQLAVIDARGLTDRPVYLTEWNRYATPGNASEEAAAAQFCRDAFADVHAWNQTPCNHNIRCMAWFVYDSNQQAGGGWDGYAIEYWRNAGNGPGSPGDLFTAFEQTVDLRYPAGAVGIPTGDGGSMIDALPQGTNIAVGASVATSSNFSSSYTGAKAVDGVVSVASRWVSSGATPPHWLRVDLGSERVVNGFVVRHAGSAGEPAHYNTRALRIQSSSSPSGPWTTETTVCNPTQESISRRTYATPRMLRHIRLEILNPGVDNYARIPEFEVYAPPPAPVAAFSGTPLSGKVPLEVSFTDQSGGTVTAWNWDFGDGTGSTVRHPSHTYAEPGSFTVTLVVTGPGGSNSLTRVAYVQALPRGADLDGDGDVDQDDFGLLQRCLLGPLIQQEPTCFGARLDEDLDVDAADMSILIDCLGSPGVSAPIECR